MNDADAYVLALLFVQIQKNGYDLMVRSEKNLMLPLGLTKSSKYLSLVLLLGKISHR